MENPARHPVHIVLAIYNLALAVVWLPLLPGFAAAPWIALAHLAGALVPWALRTPRRVPAAAGVVLDALPVIAMALFWAELGLLQALRAEPVHDEAVRRLDLAIFGVHWHEIWIRRMPGIWMSELMHFGYFLYYLVLVIPPFVILAARGHGIFRNAALAILVTYLTCFLFYLVYPVSGPRALAEATLAPATGFFHGLVEGAREAGDSPGTAFPSSHVAGAVTMAWLAWRSLSRGWAATLSIAAAWIGLSTVYTGNHYAVDALAGLLWAIPLQAWLAPRLEPAPRGSRAPEVSCSPQP